MRHQRAPGGGVAAGVAAAAPTSGTEHRGKCGLKTGYSSRATIRRCVRVFSVPGSTCTRFQIFLVVESWLRRCQGSSERLVGNEKRTGARGIIGLNFASIVPWGTPCFRWWYTTKRRLISPVFHVGTSWQTWAETTDLLWYANPAGIVAAE